MNLLDLFWKPIYKVLSKYMFLIQIRMSLILTGKMLAPNEAIAALHCLPPLLKSLNMKEFTRFETNILKRSVVKYVLIFTAVSLKPRIWRSSHQTCYTSKHCNFLTRLNGLDIFWKPISKILPQRPVYVAPIPKVKQKSTKINKDQQHQPRSTW